MVYQEKIAPPLPVAPSADEDQAKLVAELLVDDNRWVRHLIDGLSGVLRDKH